MQNTKKTLVIAAVVAALGVGAIGVGTTFASERGDRKEDRVSELVAAIAEKFDLDEAEVQEVFDAQFEADRAEMRAMHEQKFADRLAKAVEEGKLTQEQADAISDKREEMRGYMEEFKDLEPEERKEAMQGHAEELKSWAEENDIPMQFLQFGPGPKPGQGMGRPMTEGPEQES